VRIDGIVAMVVGLALAGGACLAVQNLLLSAMVGRGLHHLTALALNSIVGVTLLVLVNVAIFGPPVTALVVRAWQWWFVLPGILGTIAVFAMLYGWTSVGAVVPTVSLIAAQLVAAALLDHFRATAASRELEPLGWLGIALIVAGAGLALLFRR
jgi:transporter family-2 protein